jgi:hypothetical protein
LQWTIPRDPNSGLTRRVEVPSQKFHDLDNGDHRFETQFVTQVYMQQNFESKERFPNSNRAPDPFNAVDPFYEIYVQK